MIASDVMDCVQNPLCQRVFNQVDALDERVDALEKDAVERRTKADSWASKLDALSEQVAGLQTSVNRAAGAMWMLGGLSGLGLLSWLARWVLPVWLSQP